MYERSAIVLERYFDNLLGFKKTNNLKQNFNNYCDLFEKFNAFQAANSDEFTALEEFQAAENNIEEIQTSEEKLYKKNAKLEYNRDLIFNDITQKPDEIEKCIVKIENDISKTQANFVSLREKFVEAVRDYNEKKSKLAKCKKNRRNAESEYNVSLENARLNIENIAEEYIKIAEEFVTEENEEALISIMSDNGKEEKIPFNNSVITNAAKLGFDILKREEECYIEAYEMTKKLIDELMDGAVSVEKHQKVIRNITVKLNFLNAEKEYLIQFLDYERITVIYGKRTHRTLMIEACEKFDLDIEQINNLYQLLLKEIANKSTKKAYKELYNKSYLIDIEEKDAKFKKEKNKMNLPVGTIMNSNYWRIEGIKNIYTVFYKDVSEVFGKDLVEFDIPKEQESIEIAEEIGLEKFEITLDGVPEEVEEVKENIAVAEKKSKEKTKAKENIATIEESIEELAKETSVEEVVKEEIAVIEVNTEETKEENVEEIVAEKEIKENVAVAEKKPKEKAKSKSKENIVAIEEIVEEPIKETTEKNTKKKAKKTKRYTRKIQPKEVVVAEKIAEEPIKETIAEETVNEDVAVAEVIDNIQEIEETVIAEPIIEEITTEEPIIEEPVVEELPQEETAKDEKVVAIKKKKTYTKKKSKKPAIVETSLFETNKKEDKEEFDIFGEKYRDIEKQIAELDDLEDYSIKAEEIVEDINDDIPYEDEGIPFEEESIFENIDNDEYEELSLKKSAKSKETKKKGIFNKLRKLNAKERKEVNT